MSRICLTAIGSLLWCLTALGPTSARAAGEDEFFERKVRPVLVKHCYRCHSATAKKVRGKLRVDSREALLEGGDNGPALVPGKPDKSRLIEAVRYTNVDLQMPPAGKLPDAVINDLAEWIAKGTVWPGSAGSPAVVKEVKFDLLKRKRSHWSWQPVRVGPLPTVKDSRGGADPIDRFLLAAMEKKGLEPASPAGRAALLRRLSFDLTGLPPAPEEVSAFLADRSESAVAKGVDRLLASPRFGERWGRHWLDLVRYGETRGHEFDPPIPNAYQYRDYVIRALNEDVPYNQFVLEHIAGDLLSKPRLHPAEKFNESILGSGFWFLGEEVHSPVDIRADQADRFDNRIDVMGKTFLGLTVACARCHDHKFDAIATRDYYSLYGFLESSSYRQVRFDSRDHNLQIASRLDHERRSRAPAIRRTLAAVLQPEVRRTADYLLAAREVLQGGVPAGKADVVFEDFESGTYDRWEVTGTAFGSKPQTLKTIAPYQGRINAVGKFFVNSHNVRNGEDVTRGDAHKGRMTSRSFTIEHDYITMMVGEGAHAGKTCVDLLVGGKVVLSSTGRNSNQMFPVRWDVRRWRGKQSKIEIVDEATRGWGNIGVDHIVFTNDPGSGTPRPDANSPALEQRVEAVAKKQKLDAKLLARWVAHLLDAVRDPDDPLHAWARLVTGKQGRMGEVLAPLVADARRRMLESASAKRDVAVDFGRLRPGEWLPDDAAFGTGPVRPGDVLVRGSAEEPTISIVDHPAAAAVDPIWNHQRLSPGAENEPGALGSMIRSGRTIRTPTFRLNRDKLFYLVRGGGMAYASVGSHVMIAGPLHGRLVKHWPARSGFHWEEHDLRAYQGQFAHVEFTADGSSDFAVALVVQADGSPPAVAAVNKNLYRLISGAGTPAELAQGYQRLFLHTVKRLAVDRREPEDTEQARLANWLVRKGELFAFNAPEARSKLKSAAAPLMAEEARLTAKIRRDSRLAPAMQDGSGVDERVFRRGSHKTLGAVVGRRFLEALAGPERLTATGSGRLELARQMIDPERNPFLARVMVNRIWHHLFGRGIVSSVDNFGVLGSAPTHPELLDYLADRFVKDGWSVKKMIRRIVLTRAYRMSSNRNPQGDKLDPENLLLHRARLRRLEGEAIRDALMSVSGRLDLKMYGPSVPVYLSEFQQGRGRPASGPLDGNGRRSIYLAVRRNFLSSLLLAFDTPAPFSTVGRRTVSNVPAQSLILMNDPFVHQQARLWATHILAGKKTDKERIAEMYLAAFSRRPTNKEASICLEFLRSRKSEPLESWSDLAHALFNVKEFIFLK